MISHANNADDAGNTSGNDSGAATGSLPDASRASSPNRDLGGRRVCQKCGEKYYDLGKTPIICPNPECEAEFDPEVLLKSRRIKLQAASKTDGKLATSGATSGAEARDADAGSDNDADLGEEYDDDTDVDTGDIPPVTGKTGDNDNDE